MLNLDQMKQIIAKELPNGNIAAAVKYRDEHVFVVYRSTEREAFFDPFYAVHSTTGKFREFSIDTDADTVEITNAFKHSNLMST